MAERLPEGPDERHPVVAGLVALVGVGLVVGIVMGLVAVVGSKVLGLGGSDGGSSSAHASLYLPTPQKTTATDGPQITLAPGETASSSAAPPSATRSAQPKISLAASTTQVQPMERFSLTGVYQDGEGTILTVQRFEGGGWQDFPATGSVSGGTFQIPVETSRAGVNRFRVVDTGTGLKSGAVRITVG